MLPSVKMMGSVWVMSNALAEDGRLMGIMAGHGCLAVMEMDTWLQQNMRLELGRYLGLGLDLGMDVDLGMGLDLGINNIIKI